MSKKKIPSPIQNVADLRSDPCNANLGTDRGVAALARSLEAYGAGRAVLIDRHGVVIAGNKTVEQARRLNLPLHVVKTDGRHLVAVQREDLDLRRDPSARALAVADNRVGELDLEWNVEMLKHLREDGLDLSAFWTDVEFAHLFDEAAGGLTDDDSAVEPAATNIARGDLFVLGTHRLLCGDATSPVDVERVLDGARPMLMPTDPPYGIEYQPGWRHRVREALRRSLRTYGAGRTMWATEDALPEPRAEGRAIDPAGVERMFDATRGAHISPGELEHSWRGQPGPPAERAWPDPAGAWYCTGIDWAEKRDSTVAAVVRCDTTPLQLVAVYRTQRWPWPIMTKQVGALLDEYPGTAAHDATGAGNAMGAFPALVAHDQLQGVTLVGRVRTDLFRHDIGAIERHEIVGPRIDACYTEHKYCGEDDLFGSGHAPDTVVALALAYHAFKTGRRPSDETPAGAPAGGTR